MPVAPARLDCVPTDNIETGELKTVFGVTHVRSHNVAEHVGLAATGRTRTCAPKKLEIEIRLGSVVPLKGELISDLLDIGRLQTHSIAIVAMAALNINCQAHCIPTPIHGFMIDSIFDRLGTVHRTSSLMVADPMPRRIPLHRQIIFLSIPYLLFALVLVGIEGATRLFWPHIPPLDVLIESPAVRPDLAEFKDSPVFVADPLLFWRVRPNLKEVVWDFTVVSTNSQGWRHATDIGRKPPGAFRIVCLGDSVTFGFRVPLVFPDKPHDYARDLLPYPLLLERRLREINPGKPIDVIPLAVPAYTTYQGLNLLRREIDLLKPDVVTACFGWNDICLRPMPDRQSMPIDWAHVAVRSLMCHSQALIHFSRWSRKAKANRPSPGPPVPRVSTQDYVANLLQIANVARARGAEAVLIAPVYRDAQANPPEAALIRQYRNALHEAAQANGVPYIQIEELTETNYPANDNLFGEVIHPNADGHEIMARELLKFLSAHDMLKSLKVPQSP